MGDGILDPCRSLWWRTHVFHETSARVWAAATLRDTALHRSRMLHNRRRCLRDDSLSVWRQSRVSNWLDCASLLQGGVCEGKSEQKETPPPMYIDITKRSSP